MGGFQMGFLHEKFAEKSTTTDAICVTLAFVTLLPEASSQSGTRKTSSNQQRGVARTRVVLDTSVLIADPNCLTAYPGTAIVIPLTVVEELDGLKSRPDDVGRAARAALRLLEDIRQSAGGSLAAPVRIPRESEHLDAAGHLDTTGRPVPEDFEPTRSNESTVQIELNGIQRHLLLEHGLDADKPDNRIIGAALGQAVHSATQLISNDAALRLKAAHLGLVAKEHFIAGRATHTRPLGWTTLESHQGVIDRLYGGESIPITDVASPTVLAENSFAILRSGSQSALVRCQSDEISVLGQATPEAWGLRPRSKEQRFALELLLDPTVSVIALDGRAGTGKTVMAIAAGLDQVVEQRRYEKLAVYRPLVPVGRADVGFLPGGLEEKLDPWMSAIHDAIVALTDQRSNREARVMIDELIARNQLSLESVTFLRGRSLHRQIVVVDEAQNLEPTTLKTILTRIGEGTKVIFTGDTSQIDAPYLGEANNALAVLIGAFRGQACFGHITLTTCERSEVASLAAELL
jgi:PhoH-like ATPase